MQTSSQSTPGASRLPYLGGLDGLRALAVVAVVLYHVGVPLRGGFLGVETFFVISGFLITALLCSEWEATQRIDLAAFWLRRARRLFPALALLLVATLGIAALLPGELRKLGHDLLPAIGYVMNWHLVWSDRPYFDPVVRPPLLQHLWSLAVEEQFYLVWPVVFAGAMRVIRRRGLLVLTLLGVIASSLLLARGYRPGVDPSRLYYGTDTRAAGLLLGAALALVWRPGRLPARWPRWAAQPVAFDLLGLAGLAGLAWAFLRLYEQRPLLYRGGFVLVSLLTALVIVAVTHGGAGQLPRLLGSVPLRWLGLRSYGIYLWHWPVVVVTPTLLGRQANAGWAMVAQIVVTLLFAAASFRWVEQPVRDGRLGATWQRWWGKYRGRVPAPAPVLADQVNRTVWLWGAAMGLCAVLGLWSAVRGMASAPSALRRATAIPALAVAPMPLPGAATPMPGRTVLGTARSLSPSTLPAAASTADAETPNVGTAIPTAVPLPTVAPALAAALQAALDAAVGGAIPGVVATVKVDGEVWHGASGLRDLAAQLPMEPGTLVRLGSVSKMYTAVVALQLVQEGKLALDAPVATWLPALPVPNADLITVRQVLGQTTGLYDYLEDRNFAEQAYDEPGRRWQPAELVEYAGRSEALFLPGAPGAWDYSSTNYVILGMLVERVSGMTLDQAIHRRIIDPLALTQTFFQPDDALQGELARGYADSTDRTDAAMSFVWATGSIVASTADLQRFGTALWAGALLDEATQVEMLAVVDGYGAYNMFELAYGLGIMRNRLSVGPDATGAERSLETREVWGHIGGFAGFRAAVWHAPQGNITIALGMNQASADPNDLATALFEAVLAYQGR